MTADFRGGRLGEFLTGPVPELFVAVDEHGGEEAVVAYVEAEFLERFARGGFGRRFAGVGSGG